MYSGLWRTIKAGGIWRGDLVNKKKNGEFYWERSAISSVKNSEGDTTHFIKVAEDVTERKRAEEAMRESEARLELAIAGSDGGLWDIALNPDDPTRALPDEIMLSPRLKSFIGYANGELPNSMTAWESHIPDEDLAKLRESSRLYREGQIDQYDLEYRIRHRDGSLRWLHTCGRVERNEDGHPIRFAGIDWDITERKQVEESLLKAKETAEIAQQVAEERQQEAERRREVAESLAEIMSVLNSNQPLSDVLDYITGQAGQMLGNDAAAIYHVDAEGRLSIRAVQDLPATYVVGKQAALGHQVLEEAMVSGKAIAETAPDIIPASDGSTAEHAEGETLDSTLIDPYRAMLTAPIALGDEPYGAIALYYLDAREFTTEDTELVAVFADQIGLAIENSRLRDEVREAATIAERERLARDLHDAVTQTLFSASLIAETLPRIWERDPERAEEGLEELRQLTQGALAEMRTLLLELRPASLTEKPLGEILGHLTQAVTSRSRIPVTLSVEGHSLLPAEQQISLYRIAQEALNNVAKHAAATEAFVRLSCESRQVELSIRDNGRGFDAQEALPDQLGLSIMQERAETIGAALTIDSDASQGTTVTVVWEETAGGRSNG
jgi:PAS domain S-box-containing protein